MTDISGLAALDVALGLIFVYFVFSLIASGISEALASVFALRARFLVKGLRSMLTDPSSPKAQADQLVEAFAKHPLINGLVRNSETSRFRLPWRQPLPSYLPSRTFALTLLDTFAPPEVEQQEGGGGGGDTDGEHESQDAIARVTKKLDDTDWGEAVELPTQAKRALVGMLDDARGDIDRFREHLENWFDDTMDRVSGWYKRRVTIILFFISLGVVLAFNVDSFQIGNKLLNDETVRSAVVAQAQKATAGATPGDAKEKLEAAGKNVEELESLKLPIGWTSKPEARPAGANADPREWPGITHLSAAKLAGLLVTALALSLGAPFWFDLLNRVARLRNTGVPEGGPRQRRPRRERPETEAPTRAGGAPGPPRPPDAGQAGDPGLTAGQS